ncbi:thioredoxin family protein [Tumidithrix helvetica PCC 7403]|uniref:thioredoxin family protein n=1 Tax=Tumidithrix helvetica TaxID=3457545 RepID=UPI003CA933A5
MNKIWQRRKFLTYLGLGALGMSSAACAAQFGATTAPTEPIKATGTERDRTNTNVEDTKVATSSGGIQLPEFQGISQWLNSQPMTVKDLQGSVVLVQFWTFSCINCQRTLPYITKWHKQYASKGLRIIGVHTPEFAFEKEANNIKDAMQKHGITYPVPIDNEFKTWNAYKNQYWPHLFLADRQGIIRYDHIGEGAYDRTEQMIQQLLG